MSVQLAPGTLPAGCSNGVLEVGDVGLILGNLQYYPMYLSELEVTALLLPSSFARMFAHAPFQKGGKGRLRLC